MYLINALYNYIIYKCNLSFILDKCTINECSINNGGCSQLCVDTYDSYYCSCRKGYYTPPPNIAEQCPGSCTNFYPDLIFVIDSSGSIRDTNPLDRSYDNWNLTLEFMVNLIDQLEISNDKFVKFLIFL